MFWSMCSSGDFFWPLIKIFLLWRSSTVCNGSPCRQYSIEIRVRLGLLGFPLNFLSLSLSICMYIYATPEIKDLGKKCVLEFINILFFGNILKKICRWPFACHKRVRASFGLFPGGGQKGLASLS